MLTNRVMESLNKIQFSLCDVTGQRLPLYSIYNYNGGCDGDCQGECEGDCSGSCEGDCSGNCYDGCTSGSF